MADICFVFFSSSPPYSAAESRVVLEFFAQHLSRRMVGLEAADGVVEVPSQQAAAILAGRQL